MQEILKRIEEIGIIPVVRAAKVEEALAAVDAICAGGIPIVEITMTVPDPIGVIRAVCERYGDRVLVGAGTVLDAAQALECMDAGARFLVGPGLFPDVVSAASQRGLPAFPGALTPTEVIQAWRSGAAAVKIFPCGSAGGPNYIKALKAPLPEIPLIPTGGVTLSNAAEYLTAGAFALGAGAELVDLAAIRAGNSAKISNTARQFVELVRQHRHQENSA